MIQSLSITPYLGTEWLDYIALLLVAARMTLSARSIESSSNDFHTLAFRIYTKEQCRQPVSSIGVSIDLNFAFY